MYNLLISQRSIAYWTGKIPITGVTCVISKKMDSLQWCSEIAYLGRRVILIF